MNTNNNKQSGGIIGALLGIVIQGIIGALLMLIGAIIGAIFERPRAKQKGYEEASKAYEKKFADLKQKMDEKLQRVKEETKDWSEVVRKQQAIIRTFSGLYENEKEEKYERLIGTNPLKKAIDRANENLKY